MISKYQRWYDQIVERARCRRLRDYKERHHVVPRAFGGLDDPSNLVDLTYREHFLVHWLLTRATAGYQRRQMIYALHCMTLNLNGAPRIVAGWQYDLAKRCLKRIALETRDRRRVLIRAARLEKAKHIEEVAARAATNVTKLRIAGGTQVRGTISELANDWIRADPKRLNWYRRRRIRNTSPIPPPIRSPGR